MLTVDYSITKHIEASPARCTEQAKGLNTFELYVTSERFHCMTEIRCQVHLLRERKWYID